MFIKEYEFTALTYALRSVACEQDWLSRIEADNWYQAIRDGQPLEFSMNWSSTGPVSVEESFKQISEIEAITQLANKLNNAELIVDNTDQTKISEETLEALVKTFMEIIRDKEVPSFESIETDEDIVQTTKEKVKGYAREDAINYIISLMEKDIDTYLLFVDEILNLEEISDEDTEWKIVLFESWFEYSERKKERNKKH